MTISGTGVAGQGILVAILPTDPAVLPALAGVDQTQFLQPIIVDSQGNWTATYTLILGEFTAAIHVDPVTGLPISPPSNEVTFTLVAPMVTTTAGSTGPMLAETGPVDAAFAGPAALLLLLGGALMVVERRRTARAHKAHTTR